MHEITEVTYLRWIPLLPLIGAAINGMPVVSIQKNWGKRAMNVLAVTPVVLSFCLAVRAFFQIVGLDPEKRMLLDHMWTWIDSGSLKVGAAFAVDPLSAIMIL